MTATPIEQYGFLSDCRGSALVSDQGSVDWLCFGRFDAPALFTRLLDPNGGHWWIGPRGAARLHGKPGWRTDTWRRYRGSSLVLETRFRTEGGTFMVTDVLATGEGERGHDLGKASPGALLRIVACESGRVEVETEFAPKAEYGLVHPHLWPSEEGLRGRAGAWTMFLSTPMQLQIEGALARGSVILEAGETVSFALEGRCGWDDEPQAWSGDAVMHRVEETARTWESWAKLHQGYEGPWRDLVLLSGRVLQGLTFQPTGAMVAAPTTSLPEHPGGERNWDYRYTWIRDASLTLEALWVAACPDEAHQFFDFLARSTHGQIRHRGHLPVMLGVGGEHDLSERELDHLAGYDDSRPVRVGNAAWRQKQLDVYGQLLLAAWRLREHLSAGYEQTYALLVSAIDAAASSWHERDRGIWEVRGDEQHFLHSKLMCWAALDRGVAMARMLGAEERIGAWSGERDRVRRLILDDGWNDRRGAFTQVLGGDALDASTLLLPIVGFLPPDDDRIRRTVQAIEEELTDARGLVYRYRRDDGLEGREGTFLLCTFWLSHVQALMGDTRRARETFERAIRPRNDLGLLSEEVDGKGGPLGNFPQAFSHVGLVNAAWAIAVAEGVG